MLHRCAPKSFLALLRVAETDVHVDVTVASDGAIELRVPAYRGNILASADLAHFTERVAPGQPLTLETAIGRLDTRAEGTTQVFRRLTPNDHAGGRGVLLLLGRRGPNVARTLSTRRHLSSPVVTCRHRRHLSSPVVTCRHPATVSCTMSFE